LFLETFFKKDYGYGQTNEYTGGDAKNLNVGYQVLITPIDNCQLLYVKKKWFLVKLSSGKENCTFDWFLEGEIEGKIE